MQITAHPSLKKQLPLECREWLEYSQTKNEYEAHYRAVQRYLDDSGLLNPKAWTPLSHLTLHYDVASCDAFLRSDTEKLVRVFQHAVQLRALLFRWTGMYSDMHQDLGNWPTEFADSMRAAGPAMLSWWD